MKIVSPLIQFLLVIAIIGALTVAGIFAYMSTFGKGMIERALSDILGSGIKFKTVSLDIGKSAVRFKGLTIANEIGLEPNMFNAETFTVRLNKAALEKQKKIAIDEIVIDRASLNIERRPDGKIRLMYVVPERNSAAMDSQTTEERSGFYDLMRAVRKISIKNSVVRFWDRMVSVEPFLVMGEDVALEITADPDIGNQSGYVQVHIVSSFNIYNRPYVPGLVRINADLKVYQPFCEATFGMSASNIDITHIKPYLDIYTPFIFTKGIFDADMKANINSTAVDSLTTIYFHSVRVSVNPAKQDSEFLRTSVNKLIPYLTSNQGEIIFDFVVSGPLKGPSVSMGPKLKEAAGMAVMGEVGRYIQNMQNMQ
ncbi:MAG: hypothetical protein PHS37_08220 [Candidatus Omnitrophica bacterium]|nr:hypothetical protein [Candidatus Omnitrophota bacterium]